MHRGTLAPGLRIHVTISKVNFSSISKHPTLKYLQLSNSSVAKSQSCLQFPHLL